jgi:hypothetical protein
VAERATAVQQSAENFWRYVGDLWKAVNANAPEGMQAVAEVETRSGDKFRPGVAQRFPPFLVFEVPGRHEKTEVLIVREDDLLAIRIYHDRPDGEKYPTGFALGKVKGVDA